MKEEKYILSLDQGTTSSRAIIFDRRGDVISVAQKEFKQIYPVAGWVEHDPEDIFASELDCAREVLKKSNIALSDISAIGIANQRETTIVWDRKTGKTIYNAIVWQCSRTADYCDELKKQGLSAIIYDKTGLPINAYFSATKIRWILNNVAGAREKAQRGELAFGTVDTYLCWRLSKGAIYATDFSNASRTLLFNIHIRTWDEELLKIFDIPMSMLPEVKSSSGFFGVVDREFFGEEIKICAVAGDQQAALFGNLCVEKGMVKNTYGTGCFTLMNTGDIAVRSQHGLITTLSATLPNSAPSYVLEGSVFVGGAILHWLRDEMKMISSPHEADEIAAESDDTNGVYIVPAFVGLGAPHWLSKADGTVCGLTRGTRREHFVKACLYAIAYQVYDVIGAMERDLGEKITSLKVDGGASVSDPLMQFQADILRLDVARPNMRESTALGVCYLAGLASGVWQDVEEIEKTCVNAVVFKPNMKEERVEELIKGWQRALKHVVQI